MGRPRQSSKKSEHETRKAREALRVWRVNTHPAA
jgi:hypothetical protein